MTTLITFTDTVDTVDTVGICDICTHRDGAHDDIARRYCQATMTNALSRNCICSALPTP